MKMFFYGTLKKGQCRSHVLENQIFCGEATTKPKYKLYSAGLFPCMVPNEDGKSIPGEVYEIDDECLARLDRIEGHPHLYKREPIELNEFDGCISYFFQHLVDQFLEIDKWPIN